MHDLAAAAGVPPDLARVYPVLFDALLVIAGCSVLALRGAGLPSRIYAWICLLIVLAGLAAGGAVESARIRVPQRPAQVAAAIVPWPLVLAGLVLVLLMLRYSRIRRSTRTSDVSWVGAAGDVDAPGGAVAADFAVAVQPDLGPGASAAPWATATPGASAAPGAAGGPATSLTFGSAPHRRSSAVPPAVITLHPGEPEAGDAGPTEDPPESAAASRGAETEPPALRRPHSSPTPPTPTRPSPTPRSPTRPGKQG